MNNVSISKQVIQLLRKKPFLEEAIVMNIANLSKVTKLLQKEINESSFHAVHAALRRHSELLVKEKSRIQKKILKILSDSKLSIKSGLMSVKLIALKDNNEKLIELMSKGADINLIKGAEINTIIIGKEHEKILEKLKGIEEINKNLGAVIIKSPKEILYTKGFVAFIANMISREDINIIDFIWSGNNTIILVDEKDAGKIYSLLVEYLK
ncbi:MAG: hypothetical protein WC393_04535 [Candidatus Nanoarchaeia archaeon]|jgi:hypothetical protein